MNPKHTPLLPVVVFAGTILQDANGNTLFTACEESELRGGTYDSIRETLKLAAKAINLLDGLPDVELDGLAAQGGVKAVLNRLCADNERLREALRDLLEPLQADDHYCEYCDRHAPKWSTKDARDGTLTGEPLTHVPGCVVLKARAALSATERMK